ncbi:FAD-dependent tricarballylate dehydrogenase TcuA [Nocardioides pyridinolyticus]
MSKRVIVVGGGNAALCAALSARENGADVVVLERAEGDLKGGNTAFTAGAMRVAYEGVDDLLTLMPELTEDELAITDFGTYSASDFFDDLARVTEYRTDPELASVLADESLPTLQWMNKQGVRFVPIYGRQAFKIDGRFKFWGGLTVEVSGGGPGLVDALTKAAANAGVQVEYGARVLSLIAGDQGVTGVKVRQNGVTREEHADAVILASGGFQANTAWRTQYLGPNWDLAKVRGTQFNTGDGHSMALGIGASPAGNWSGCHAVSWELNAPEFGDMAVGDHFQKHSYPWSVMINAEGKRFVDEGADFRNYTYAKYGRRVLEQPGQFAWQVFDSKVSHLLRDEYRIKQVTKVTANTLEELAEKMDGVDAAGFLAEIRAYNAAVNQDVAFDPNVKDGRGTTGLAVNKSNWANTIEDGPFEAYGVTCGITFTFGGLRINTDAQVLDTDQRVIPGLYAAGEIVGGVFYFNYPGGSGLTNGSVFGKIAGANAAC